MEAIKPILNLNKKKNIIKTFTLPQDTIDELNKELKEAGYGKGLKDINFSDLLDRLIKQYTAQLKKENNEDNN